MADAEPQQLSYVQRLELRRLETSAGVVQGSVVLGRDDEGPQQVSFDLETEPTVEPAAADVRPVEPVHFVYGEGRRFGETAPTWVMCERPDFPREVGHLCAGPPGCPAVPCLSIGGMQPLYERGGIEVIMERLRHFMRDAKTGTLMADGWEPVPFSVDQKFTHGEIEPHRFQNHAAAHPEGGYAVGAALHLEHSGAQHVLLHPEVIPIDKIGLGIGARNEEGRKDGFRAVPWVFLWPPGKQVETAPIFQAWRTQGELRAGLARIGVKENYDAALGQMHLTDVNFRVKRPPLGGKSFAVILGVWRPAPIMSAFFGYASDPAARTLELRAYLVSQDGVAEILADDARVEAIIGSYPPRPELLRWVSGVEAIPPTALFGAGALGIALFENLVRAGADDLFVQDKDSLGAHNLARHSGRLVDVYKPKTELADTLSRTIVQDGSMSIATSTDDLDATDLAALQTRVAGRLVIDATADERVRMRMDELRPGIDETMVRSEIFHEGRLGTTFVSVGGGPTPSELAQSLIASAAEEPAVAAWLEHEAQYPLGPNPMLYGFGCTSQTVHLPNFVVEQHAAVAMTAILDQRDRSGVLINPLDERYRPLGHRWLAVAPFTSIVPPTEPGWVVRLSAPALERIETERQAALPDETGGYLYGQWDPVRQSITVLCATSLPPGSQATPTELELGPAGQTQTERRLVRKSRGRLYLCGTWHSHTGTSARMSGRDQKAMMKHRSVDAAAYSPTLIVIAADGDVQAHLRVL